MRRFKRWLVFRWLGVISPEDLLTLAQDRKLKAQFNAQYQELVDSMLNLYFENPPQQPNGSNSNED